MPSPMDRRHFLGGIASGVGAVALWQLLPGEAEAAYAYTLTDAQWRKKLSPWAYKVLRQEATEHPYSSPLNDEHRAGIFACAGCAQKLFSSKTKFDSGTGWPSFWAPLPRVATSRWAIRAPKCIARVAAGIWAMCSMMAPSPLASVIA